MGATIGAAVSGARVLWVSNGRSEESRQRAWKAGLVEVETPAEAIGESDAVLSVCPPHAAEEVAHSVADLGFAGLYVDANAVSRATAQRVGEAVRKGGATFVDGAIIGPPVTKPGRTRLYLSGAGAEGVAELFSGGMLDAKVIEGDPGAASALKMTYAAWTKGSDALILAIRALAVREGVDEALLGEWARSQPNLGPKSERAASVAAPKGWRYVGEMEEIAASFGAAGLPTGFHEAAADLYRRLAPFKDRTDPGPEVKEVLDAL
jgi:3-hydroxyisobutyrate dehydrogenase-like beta-hydroxyacid dehydrogenase